MKVLWVCNIMLPMIARALGRACSNKEGWLTGVMEALLAEGPGRHDSQTPLAGGPEGDDSQTPSAGGPLGDDSQTLLSEGPGRHDSQTPSAGGPGGNDSQALLAGGSKGDDSQVPSAGGPGEHGDSQALNGSEGFSVELGVAFPIAPGEEPLRGSAGRVRYYGFRENTGRPEVYDAGMEREMAEILRDFQPDILHCFGTEYPHTLAALRAYGRPGSSLVSIQGLCAVYAEAYMANIPGRLRDKTTFRDWVKRDNMRRQQEKFRRRGQWEQEAVRLTGHVAGRTDWDRYWTAEWNPGVRYHLLRETLRPCFYEGQWQYGTCRQHSIFMSQGDYPIKGLHYMLDAMPVIRRRYPDVHLYVAGNCLLRTGPLAPLKISGYGRLLEAQIREYGLKEAVTFLGSQDAEQMKEQYLRCNAYVCVSSIENSPNSLGEAMLLGVPVAAALTGGVGSMISPGEGWLFPGFSGDQEGEMQRISRDLGEQILEIFALRERVAERTRKGREHARQTHDAEENLRLLLDIYRELA